MADILADCKQVAKDLRGGSPYQAGLASCLEDAADEIERLRTALRKIANPADATVTDLAGFAATTLKERDG